MKTHTTSLKSNLSDYTDQVNRDRERMLRQRAEAVEVIRRKNPTYWIHFAPTAVLEAVLAASGEDDPFLDVDVSEAILEAVRAEHSDRL